MEARVVRVGLFVDRSPRTYMMCENGVFAWSKKRIRGNEEKVKKN